ncbi:Uncharacterised protein [Yersinia wautersii]|uniref:Uncharacterized protein n=1 Tax=Yersinia wautersii TaxID=1341643 RepID=A0ABM9TIT5_9GAMM|nr:hypothetical protein [Yersinia wautersii]CRG51927.1 Uncharacterised protein [Yersinia wautersii]
MALFFLPVSTGLEIQIDIYFILIKDSMDGTIFSIWMRSFLGIGAMTGITPSGCDSTIVQNT